MRFVIIHGFEKSSKEDWLPWLVEELKKAGHEAVAPDFPEPDEPKLDKWLETLEKNGIGTDTVLVGHSLGAVLILRELEKRAGPVGGCFLVSGFSCPLGTRIDEKIKSFFGTGFDWEKIKGNAGEVKLYFSDNDPYVPLEAIVALSEGVGVEPEMIPGGGHLNGKSGYRTFPRLLEDLVAFAKRNDRS